MFFQQLYELAKRAGGGLTITLAPAVEGAQMTVVVAPKGGDKAEPALSTPLVLTATAQEFDATEGGFLDALGRYDAKHRSLMDQVEATSEVLAAAREAQVKKGATATTKAVPAKAVAKPAPVADDDDADGDGDEGGGEPATSGPAAAASAGAGSPALFG